MAGAFLWLEAVHRRSRQNPEQSLRGRSQTRQDKVTPMRPGVPQLLREHPGFPKNKSWKKIRGRPPKRPTGTSVRPPDEQSRKVDHGPFSDSQASGKFRPTAIKLTVPGRWFSERARASHRNPFHPLQLRAERSSAGNSAPSARSKNSHTLQQTTRQSRTRQLAQVGPACQTACGSAARELTRFAGDLEENKPAAVEPHCKEKERKTPVGLVGRQLPQRRQLAATAWQNAGRWSNPVPCRQIVHK